MTAFGLKTYRPLVVASKFYARITKTLVGIFLKGINFSRNLFKCKLWLTLQDCPIVSGSYPPISTDAMIHLCGRNKGIQGHQNSCYLDATLFAMFSFTR